MHTVCVTQAERVFKNTARAMDPTRTEKRKQWLACVVKLSAVTEILMAE